MNKRIIVNLIAFGLVSFLMIGLAVQNLFSLDAVDDPYYLTARFEDSPGLRKNFEVAYLGVQIGKIDSVTLADGYVDVRLRINDGEKIPADATAGVRRKSAVGEPFVDFAPAEGRTGNDGPWLEAGDLIGVERTDVPLTYTEVFTSLDRLVRAVPKDDMETVIHELAVGLDGRADALRRIILNSDDALATFADNTDLFEQLTGNLTRLTGVIVDHQDSFGRGFDNLEPISASLAASRTNLERVLSETPEFTGSLADLVEDNRATLDCTIGGLGTTLTRLSQDDVTSALISAIDLAPELRQVFIDAFDMEDDGLYVRASVRLNLGLTDEPPAPVYDTPLPDPTGPEIPLCPGAPVSDGAEDNPAGSGEGGGAPGEATGPSPAAGNDPDVSPETDEASSEQPAGSSPFNPLWAVALLVALALVAALRPWRLFSKSS